MNKVMLCMICKTREARVHLTQIDQGKIKKVDLCEQCAKEKGVDDPTGYALADLLLGLGVQQESSQPTSTVTTCRSCGLTATDFKKSGRLGCPDCYPTFKEILTGWLKSMHRSTRHTGKRPGAVRRSVSVNEQLAQLQQQLAEAIAVENYEEAARIRDRIKALKGADGQVLNA